MGNLTIRRDSNADYHGNKDYIGSTSLKKYLKSPAHFVGEEEKDETEALKFGSAYHSFVLENETFKKDYFVFDDSEIIAILVGEGSKNPRNTNKYKAWVEETYALATGKEMISRETYKQMQTMKDVLFNHFFARYLLTGGESELSHYTEIDGVKVKIRPDHMIKDKRTFVDLKTCKSAEFSEFQKHSAQMKYHLSVALYADILESIYSPGQAWDAFLIAQEKTAPYCFSIFSCNGNFMRVGQYEYTLALQQHKYCLETGIYEGYTV
jgi:hypothetical protein